MGTARTDELAPSQTKRDLLEAIKDSTKHNSEDKLRLMLCYYFSMLASGSDKGLSNEDLAEYERALKEVGADMAPWEFAKRSVSSFLYALSERSSAAGQRERHVTGVCSSLLNPARFRQATRCYADDEPRSDISSACTIICWQRADARVQLAVQPSKSGHKVGSRACRSPDLSHHSSRTACETAVSAVSASTT